MAEEWRKGWHPERVQPRGSDRAVFTGARETLAADAVVLVTARLPEDAVALALERQRAAWGGAGIEEVTVIGDAWARATIAHATYAGRRYGEECDTLAPGAVAPPLRRELAELLPP